MQQHAFQDAMRSSLAMLLAALALAGCGGGGGSSSETPAKPALKSGAIDPDYGSGGRVNLGYVYSLTVEPQGSAYVVAGATITDSARLLRLDAAGRQTSLPEGVPSDPALRVPAVGDADTWFAVKWTAGFQPVVVKRDSRGLVTTFGDAGTASLSAWGFTEIVKLATDSAGNVYVEGYRGISNHQGSLRTHMIAKLDPRGQRDVSYGPAGLGFFDPPYARITFDRSGNAYSMHYSGSEVDLAKFGANGLPAAGFGSGGMVDFRSCDAFSGDLHMDADDAGNVYVAGTCSPGVVTPPYRAFVAKVDPSGALDRAFGSSGIATGFFTPRADVPYGAGMPGSTVSSVMVGQEGAVYVAANAKGDLCPGGGWAIVKLGSDGRPLESFGDKGRIDLAWGVQSPVYLAQDVAGRLYVAVIRRPAECPASTPSTFDLYRFGG